MNFKSDDISIFPTAWRQYTNDGDTTVVNIEARLNTEYNITNLVNGLLDQEINNGNFVVEFKNNTLKFCMQGYYFQVNNFNTYTNMYPLYVKIRVIQTNVEHPLMKEIVPIGYETGNTRNLDTYDSGADLKTFIGLDYINDPTGTEGYFQIFDEQGNIPEKSWLRFSTNQIGYFDGTNWYAITSKFVTDNLTTKNILKDDNDGFIIKNINDNNKNTLGIIVNAQGKIVSNDQSNTVSCTNGVFDFVSAVTTDKTGKLSSVTTKAIPVDTNDFNNDDSHLPSSKLVKAKIDTEASTRSSADNTLQANINSEASTRSSADTQLQTNINNEATARSNADTALGGRIDSEASARSSADDNLSARITTNVNDIASLNSNKVSKGDLKFEFANGTLTITKSY